MLQKTCRPLFILILIAVQMFAGIMPALAAPPVNDNFADAMLITLPFSTVVDLTDAGEEIDEPQSCSNSDQTVWYSFTPSESMTLHLTVQGNDIPGSVGVYRAVSSGITGLFTLQCLDFYNLATDVPLEEGFTYYFQVNAFVGTIGSVQIDIDRISPPSNDNFINAKPVTTFPFHSSVDSRGASREIGEPYDCYGSRYTVWYVLEAIEDGVIRADMNGSNFGDTQLAVYWTTGPDLGNLNLVTCGVFGTSVLLNVQAGTTYYFQAGAVASVGGDLHVNIESIPPPSNDDFAEATAIPSLPYTTEFDTSAATFEGDEPSACGYPFPPYKTIWYTFTALQDGSLSASVPNSNFAPFLAIYSGTDLNNLNQLACGQYSNKVTFQVTQNQTYHFQVGGYYGEGGPGSFLLEIAPPPQVGIYFYPGTPSKYDTIQFCSSSYDPANIGIQSFTWDFGDGTTAADGCSTHQYVADGDYTVQHTATTFDGRTASAPSQVVQVRTHDVAITKLITPNSASVGQTKLVSVTVRNTAYPETVQVDLYKSTPSGFVWVATLTKSIPVLSANRTTAFNFNYTFTSDDARIGKVTFKAIAAIVGANDALPGDNELSSSPPTKVAR